MTAELLSEGRSIQQRIYSVRPKHHTDSKLVRPFTDLMFQGKTKTAIRLLLEKGRGSVLQLDDVTPDYPSVLDTLWSKHFSPQPCLVRSLITPVVTSSSQVIHPFVYEAIDACSIRRAALQTYGAAGLSVSYAACWRRMCTSFKKSSVDLCDALAYVAKKLCSSLVDSRGVSNLPVFRLIALSKDPCVRPIGICEVARRIIAKTVAFISKLAFLKVLALSC